MDDFKDFDLVVIICLIPLHIFFISDEYLLK